jgi:hypothetical protein
MAEDVEESPKAPEAPEAPEQKTAFSIFKGFKIEVKLPTPDQLGIYRVLQKKFRRAANRGDDLAGDEASQLLGNIFELVTSIVVDPDDADLIQSEILAGRATMADTLPLINDGVEALKVANSIKDEQPKTQVVTGS